MNLYGDYISTEKFTVEELRTAALKGRGDLSPLLALRLLALKDYAEKEPDMRYVLQSPDADPGLRLTAAQSLASIGSDAARQTLLDALDLPDAVIVRGVVAALARIGGDEVLRRTRHLAPSVLNDTARVQMARAAYELNDEGFDLPKHGELPILDPSQFEMQPVPSEAVSARVFTKVLTDLELGGLRLNPDKEARLKLKCKGGDLFVVLDKSLKAEGVETLGQRRRVVGVVAEFEEVETEQWETAYHILTQPSENDRLDIYVVSEGGEIAYAGQGKTSGKQLNFTIRAINRPGAHAAVIEGVYQDGQIQLTSITVSTQRQQRRIPQRG
ncbi:MAG: HEAT repeat domain-containing protein [Anaerolineae bacterium]